MRADVYIYPISQVKLLSENFCKTRFPKRMEKASGYRNEEARDLSIGAGALLTALGFEEENVRVGECGKPYSATEKRKFNLSHSKDYVALAVSDGEIGLDIQKISDEHTSVARRMFTPREREYIREDTAKRFTTLWTVKESIVKLLGTGLSHPIAKSDVLDVMTGEPLVYEGTSLFVSLAEFDGYCLCVAQADAVPEVTLHLLEAKDVIRLSGGNNR